MWLWSSRTGATPAEVDRLWQAFLRRFDIEHTFRFFKQVLGWTRPKLRAPAAADRWTWLIIAAHAQLRLARTLAADLRLPRQRPAPDGRLTPARVRRGFRNIRATAGCPAGAPKPGKPGPGRPPGSKNRRPAPSYDVGKTIKRQTHPQNQARTRRLNGKLRLPELDLAAIVTARYEYGRGAYEGHRGRKSCDLDVACFLGHRQSTADLWMLVGPERA